MFSGYNRHRLCPKGLLGLLTGTGLMMATASAHAVAVAHIYDLNGSLADQLGGSALTNNGATLGASGLTFGVNQGPSLSSAITSNNYSIEMVFSLDAISNYRKLIDFKDRAVDTGLYNQNGNLAFYNVAASSSPAFTVGQSEHLVLTRDSGTNTVVGYVNGVQLISFVDTSSLAVFSGANSIIHFLRDDSIQGTEASSGFLDRIRIYDGALSAAQVLDIYNGGQPPAGIPEPGSLTLLLAGALGWRIRGRAG